jgi:hypothetical protein
MGTEATKGWFVACALSLAGLFTPSSALAEVRLDGAWDGADPSVSLHADQVTRQQALGLLSEASGWSIVALDLGSERLDLTVRDQPASKVLGMILSDQPYVAVRDGDRLTIAPEDLAQPAAAAQPEILAAADATTDRDRSVFGGNLRIEKGEKVRDVQVVGGKVDVFGEVEGDVEVMGGEAWVHEDARVGGDISVTGGGVHLADRSRVEGDVDITGGELHRAAGAYVGGDVSGTGADRHHTVIGTTGSPEEGWSLARLASDTRGAISRTTLLFLFGVIFWALLSQRMEALEVEVAARPMRSLALGLVGVLTAVLASIVLFVTMVGIPFALAGITMTIVVAYVGACVVLSTVGQALLRHRTKNRYVHLAVGCALFLLFTAIPYVGSFVWAGVLLMGLGAVVATRGAGLVPGREPQPDRGPYRTAAV